MHDQEVELSSVRRRPRRSEPAPLPADEVARVAALHRYEVLDTPPEPAFDDIARLASDVCGTPIALVSLVDTDRQWFKASVGLDPTDATIGSAFCAHAILAPDEVMVVPDALADARFVSNPLVVAEPFIRFYAGVPLIAPGGHAIGTLCVLDLVPKQLTADQLAQLQALGRQVTAQLELRRTLAAEVVASAERFVEHGVDRSPEPAADPAAHGAAVRRWRVLKAAAVAAVLAAGFVLQTWGGSSGAKVFADLAFVLSSGSAAFSCFRRARLQSDRARPWQLLGVGTALWSLGALAWAFFGMTRDQQHPFPSVADIGFVGYALPVVVGLWMLRARAGRPAARAWSALDALVIASSTLFVSWATVLGPLFHAPASGLFVRSVSLAYPVVDVVVLSSALAFGIRQASGHRRRWSLLAAGFAILAGADSVYTSRQLAGAYDNGHLLDIGWIVAFALVALAAAAPDEEQIGSFHRLSIWQELAPYVPVLGGIVIAAGRSDIGPATEPFLFWLGLLALTLVTARQAVVIVERAALAADLEGRVIARTAEADGQRRFLGAVLDSLEEGVAACDADGGAVIFNRSMRRLYGHESASPPVDWAATSGFLAADGETALAAEETPLLRALRGQPVLNDELALSVAGHARRMVSANARPITTDTGQIVGAVTAIQDITERARAQQDLHRRATSDELTGVANRAEFNDVLDRLLAAGEGTVAVLLIDLDDFKLVNDTLGHVAGDALLVEVARRLCACGRDGDVVARLGGDEFTIVLPGENAPRATAFADRLLTTLAHPVAIGESRVHIRASVGIAIGGDGHTGASLLRDADLAMYAAKSAGKAKYALFSPSMKTDADSAVVMENDLRQALHDGSFHLAYQPVVDLAAGRITGAEALLRWDHPQRGAVPPTAMIPIAEQTGLIVPIGDWVLAEACRQLAAWDDVTSQSTITMAVNISVRQLERPGLVEVIRHELASSGVAPERLILEITESSLMDVAELRQCLHRLHDLGVKISIDDFGTGYSSLARLRSSPIHYLKLDRIFVSEIEARNSEVPILRATLAMADGLGLGVVAEGIESAEQFAYLNRLGCQGGQGFLMSRPVPPDRFLDLLRSGVSFIPTAAMELDDAESCEIERLVAVAISPDVAIDQLIRPLLAALERLSGLESTYLTRIDWHALEQHIVFSHNVGPLTIDEGLVVDWSDTLCRRALEGGPCNVSDVPAVYPDSAAAASLGIISYVTVGIEVEGSVFGTLCGMSSQSKTLTEAQMASFKFFARLIAEKLAQGRGLQAHSSNTPNS